MKTLKISENVMISVMVLIVMIFSFVIVNNSEPQVVVKDGMVVEVNGEPVYREVGKWDILEANIIEIPSENN